MNKIYFVLAIAFLFSLQTNAQPTITKVSVNTNVNETVEKLTSILSSKGLKVFAVIDHQKGAESASLDLLPTTLIIFGNPKMGTKLMNCDQDAGVDLPMKYLVYEDKDAKTWISYWKPSLLANKYRLDNCKEVLAKMDGALAKFASLAAK